MKKVFLVFLMMITGTFVSAQSTWSIGPMLHWNIGDKKVRTTFGVEFSYWNWRHFPYSIDGGVDFGKQRIRFYSEVQTGVGVAGVAAGPVFEIQTDKPAFKPGFQFSVWGCYIAGFDVRFRFIGKHGFFCPGLFLKIPFHQLDANGDPVKGLPSYHHHHDDD